MIEYRVVNESEFNFAKNCELLMNEGFRPCSGISVYQREVYCHFTYKNKPVQFFVQSFTKGKIND